MGADRYHAAPGTLARFVEVNEGAATLLGRALKRMARTPLATLAGFGRTLFRPVLHPIQSVKETYASYRQDGWLEGALNVSLWASTLVCTLSLLGMAAAWLAAPLTGGASLAAMPLLGTALTWAGLHDVVVCTGLLAKDEYDAMTASDEERLYHQEEQLADDFLNTGMAWATVQMSNLDYALTVTPQGMVQAARDGLRPGMRKAAAALEHGAAPRLTRQQVQQAAGRVASAATRDAASKPN
jgi:hypothetical protein